MIENHSSQQCQSMLYARLQHHMVQAPPSIDPIHTEDKGTEPSL